MKFFVAFVALVAVAVASPLVKPVSSDIEALEAIVAAINSPNTDPATAALLEEQLQDVLGSLDLHPISVGPAIVLPEPIAVGPAIIPEPISVGPAIVDFPLPEGALAPIVAPSPVAIIDGPAPVSDSSSAPLVQIILNINQASAGSVPVDAVIGHEPVQVVETAPIPVEPVQVVEISPEPVQVVEVAPVPAEPVIIGVPVIPSPAITLPEELN
ncbi:actin cytoskeleton-regulatory complex protein PAN1-like [Trichoplusia ni]|uniref:Actin cytoskeleton-regulatory complex protein PAN1-like n=1 Tax=Trichoplusia ni TaxID=7111 RepID=A0A7E5WSZ4_TRINI|nr:actin cytoskeleton-regulatory complex protein PAN1-like [Trichoplusia ni]